MVGQGADQREKQGQADDVHNGRLPIYVRRLLDEFANIGQIPQFEKLIAAICSREKSAFIILQLKSQLKALHKDNASTIEGNCDTTLFLGGKEKDILKDLAEILEKETIDLYNVSYIIRYYVMSEGVSVFNELEK